jgi:DNA adenine methylase
MAKREGALYGELLMTNYDPTPFLADQLTLFSDLETEKLRLKLVHIPERAIITL